MDKNRIIIAVIEPSHIIFEGISNVLMKFKKDFYLYRFNDLEELKQSTPTEGFNVAVINPSAVQNKLNDFVKLKNAHSNTLWIALVYSFFANDLLQKFDDTLSVNASLEQIFNKLGQINNSNDIDQHEDLSDRETEVLIQLVKGHSNKEIAEKLNISIHTVISHRKHIIDKTGIKSLSGLTIYAIIKKIVPLEYGSM